MFVGGVVVDARPTSVGHDTGEHGATKPEQCIARTNQNSLHAEHHHTAGTITLPTSVNGPLPNPDAFARADRFLEHSALVPPIHPGKHAHVARR